MMLEEMNDLPLSPAPVIAIRVSKKGAMAPVVGFQQCNTWVGQHFCARFRKQTDERIVRCMDHQGWPRDLVDNPGR